MRNRPLPAAFLSALQSSLIIGNIAQALYPSVEFVTVLERLSIILHTFAAPNRGAGHRLFPLATVITPNLMEASALLGGRPVEDLAAMQAAAKQLHSMGPCYVLVKGGHLRDTAHSGTSDATAIGAMLLRTAQR